MPRVRVTHPHAGGRRRCPAHRLAAHCHCRGPNAQHGGSRGMPSRPRHGATRANPTAHLQCCQCPSRRAQRRAARWTAGADPRWRHRPAAMTAPTWACRRPRPGPALAQSRTCCPGGRPSEPPRSRRRLHRHHHRRFLSASLLRRPRRCRRARLAAPAYQSTMPARPRRQTGCSTGCAPPSQTLLLTTPLCPRRSPN